MRDSNYRSITANRAAATISTTLYDRRALDCTSDKPLVNSLNHLTFLASSSGKVRETLSNDGGLERLVDILYDCKLDSDNQSLDENPLVAWKWSLAFQCLVLVGTRGTEAIRKKVVDAGMIPVIATVLDNYLAINAGETDRPINTNQDFSFEERAELIQNTFARAEGQEDEFDVNEVLETENTGGTQPSQVENNTTRPGPASTGIGITSPADNIIKGLNQYRKRNKQLHFWPDHIEQLKEKIELMHQMVNLTSSDEFDENDPATNKLLIDFVDEKNFNLDATKGKYAKFKKNRRQLVDLTAPRNFINGILVPREDDVLWSLQLLAFISKYSYLKPALSETNIISGMSLRSPPSGDRLSFKGSFSNSVPALENDDIDNENELEEIRSVENDSKDDCDEIMIDTEGENNNSNHVTLANETNDPILDNKVDFMLPLELNLELSQNEKYLNQPSVVCADPLNIDILNQEVDYLESVDDRLLKALNFIKLSKILNKDLKSESLKYKNFKIRYNKLESDYIKSKWNYASYPFLSDLKEDQDLSIKPLKTLNIFPLVEKFTTKSHRKEILYWSGVIMRNSCRRDESKGGVRQCASFTCGKWEEYPRQFAKCRRCKRTKYCSKECQSNLWEYHRHWCIETTSSSSSAPSTSAANLSAQEQSLQLTGFTTAANGIRQPMQRLNDEESVLSSLNTTTTAGMLRQHVQQQQPTPQNLMANPLGEFSEQEAMNVDQPLTRATTPQATTNSIPTLGPANARGMNFGTILFHNAVHATLTATNNNNNNLINNRNNNLTNNILNNLSVGTDRFTFGGFGNNNATSNSNNDDTNEYRDETGEQTNEDENESNA